MSQAKALRAFAEFALGDDAAITSLAKGLSARGVDPATIMAKQAVEAVGGNPGKLDPKPVRMMDIQSNRGVRYSPREVTPQAPAMKPAQKGTPVEGFEEFTGGQMRRQQRPRMSPEDAASYRQYGKDLIEKQGNLDGQMRVNSNGMEYDLKQNSKPLADGSPSLKVRSRATKEFQTQNRQRMEAEQTLGNEDAYSSMGGHHRLGALLVDKMAEGLTGKDRKTYLKYVRKTFGGLGNEDFNLDQLPPEVHNMIHNALDDAGLDARRMDFRNATLMQRLKFLRAVEKILKGIDEITYEAMKPPQEAP